jgi:hypothetical protein
MNFPISKPMVGSVIPGPLMRVQTTRSVNYPDGHRVVKQKKVHADPTISFPTMNNQHGDKSSILEKLKQLMAGGGKQHPHAAMGQLGSKPTMAPGYEPIRENLQWRAQ